jgi:hypothetical protein
VLDRALCFATFLLAMRSFEAVYRAEIEKFAAAERKFQQTLPPKDALRAWMLLFVDYFATKKSSPPR